MDTVYHLQGDGVQRNQGQVHGERRRRTVSGHHNRKAFHRDRRTEKERHRSPSPPLRPYVFAGRLQQKVRHERRTDPQHNTISLRKEADNIPPCGHSVPQRRHISEMRGHAIGAEGLRDAHPAAGRQAAEKVEESVRLIQGDRPPCHHSHGRGGAQPHRHGASRLRPCGETLHKRVLPGLQVRHDHRHGQGRGHRVQGHRQDHTRRRVAQRLCKGCASGQRRRRKSRRRGAHPAAVCCRRERPSHAEPGRKVDHTAQILHRGDTATGNGDGRQVR